jgi:hypothetical protein
MNAAVPIPTLHGHCGYPESKRTAHDSPSPTNDRCAQHTTEYLFLNFVSDKQRKPQVPFRDGSSALCNDCQRAVIAGGVDYRDSCHVVFEVASLMERRVVPS